MIVLIRWFCHLVINCDKIVFVSINGSHNIFIYILHLLMQYCVTKASWRKELTYRDLLWESGTVKLKLFWWDYKRKLFRKALIRAKEIIWYNIRCCREQMLNSHLRFSQDIDLVSKKTRLQNTRNADSDWKISNTDSLYESLDNFPLMLSLEVNLPTIANTLPLKWDPFNSEFFIEFQCKIESRVKRRQMNPISCK